MVTVVSLSVAAAIGVTVVLSGTSEDNTHHHHHHHHQRRLQNKVKTTTKGHVEGEIDWLNRGVGAPTKSPSSGLHRPTWKPSFKPVESADVIALNPRTIGLGGMKGLNHKWDEKEILHLTPTHNIDEKKIGVTEDVVTTTDVVVPEDVTVPPIVDITLNDVITTFTDSTVATPPVVVSTVDNTVTDVVVDQNQFVRSLIRDPPPGSKGALTPPVMAASRPETVVDVKHGGIDVDADVVAEIEAAATAAKVAEEQAAAEAAEAARLKEEEELAAQEAAEKEQEEAEEREKEEEAEVSTRIIIPPPPMPLNYQV